MKYYAFAAQEDETKLICLLRESDRNYTETKKVEDSDGTEVPAQPQRRQQQSNKKLHLRSQLETKATVMTSLRIVSTKKNGLSIGEQRLNCMFPSKIRFGNAQHHIRCFRKNKIAVVSGSSIISGRFQVLRKESRLDLRRQNF